MYSRDPLHDALNAHILFKKDSTQITAANSSTAISKGNYDGFNSLDATSHHATLERIQKCIKKGTMVSPELLAHVINEASRVLPCYLQQPLLSPVSNGQLHTSQALLLPSLASFIGYIIHRSHTSTSTVIGLLVFLKRLRGSLLLIAEGMPCSAHRIFVATLIVASKALHDTSPKNKHWARYVKHFALEDINLMERQVLEILNYRLIISSEELVQVYHEFEMAAFRSPLILDDETRFATLQLTEGIQPHQQQAYQRTSYIRHHHRFVAGDSSQLHQEEYRKGKFIIRKPFVPTIDTSVPQQLDYRKEFIASYAPSISSNSQTLPATSNNNSLFNGSFLSYSTVLPTVITPNDTTMTALLTGQDNNNNKLAPSLSSSSLSSSLSDETIATLTDEEAFIEGKNSCIFSPLASEILRHAS